jgi:hypothetical protein
MILENIFDTHPRLVNTMYKSCVSVNHIYMSKLFTHIVVMYKIVLTLSQGPCKCFGSCKCIYYISFV